MVAMINSQNRSTAAACYQISGKAIKHFDAVFFGFDKSLLISVPDVKPSIFQVAAEAHF